MKSADTVRLRYEQDVILKQEFFEPNGWARPIEDQMLSLRGIFPDIRINHQYFLKKVSSPRIDGTARVIVPKKSYLASKNDLRDPYSRIGILIEQACSFLNDSRHGEFTHYRRGQLSSDRIRCIRELINRRKHLEASVPGDVLILDVSLGGEYAGWTPRRARGNIVSRNDQIALSSVDIAWIVLINPNRFHHCNDLSVDSVMEEYFSEDRAWECVLFFYFRGGRLEFGYRWGRRAYMDSGAAVAFL